MSRSPAVARRRLGAELRGLREAAGKKIDDAARALECSTAKISRLENGKGVPRGRDVRDLLDLYGADGERDRLLELAYEGQGQDWWNDFRDVVESDMFADHLLRYVALEQDASVIKSFEADLIPGLLQTAEYIDAVCSIVFPDRSAKERARFVEFRQERQKILRRDKDRPELGIILGEAALVRPIGGREVMRRQLEHLLTALDGELEDVDFRLTLNTTQASGALGGPFAIIKFADTTDQNVVYLEGREGATWLESDGDVARYEMIYSGLERDSLSRPESIKRLSEEVERLKLAGSGRSPD